VKEVQMMDAHHMTFADATFDCVVAQFVITLVENPEQVLSECHRVVKPGGRIILVNHLFSETGGTGEQRGRAGAPAA
jgi:phosphatidylethanolamine/phosphatidyl-N-methylethanolamine N-methyltransferase